MALWRAKKDARTAAAWATKAAAPRFNHDGGRLPVKIIAHPPINRARDADNAIAQMKAALDGISDGLGVNDSLFDLTFEWGDVVSRGKVIVEIGA